jgi:hypothetical protein
MEARSAVIIPFPPPRILKTQLKAGFFVFVAYPSEA